MADDRDYGIITMDDMIRLQRLALEDLESLFDRCPETGKLYRNQLLGIALCQGAALHLLDGANGIKDFDVWSFFIQPDSTRPFPYRWRAVVDFGDPKFGVTADSPHFVGRRVDLLGRSLKCSVDEDPSRAIQDWLGTKNSSPKMLAKKQLC